MSLPAIFFFVALSTAGHVPGTAIATPGPCTEVEPLAPAGARTACLVLPLRGGAAVVAHNASVPMIPASTAKLVTAVAALELLGPERRLRTELRITGRLERGRLHGDLVLRGGGDPLLDLDHLLTLARALAERGIERVEGRFLIDDSAFVHLPLLDPGSPVWAAWNAGVGPLGVAFNRVQLIDGDPPWTVPPLFEAEIVRAPQDTGAGDGIALRQTADGRKVWIIAAGRAMPEALPVRDPGMHAGHLFAMFAAALGIDLPRAERGRPQQPDRLLAAHESATIRELAAAMLRYSNNQVAEMLGLATAVAAGLAPASGRGDAAAFLLERVARRLGGTDWSTARLVDLSGLGPGSRLTAAQLAALVRAGWQRHGLGAMLPVAAWSGTLASRLRTPELALRLWAKTGTLDYASALAGMLLPRSGQPLIVVLLVDDPAARAALDAPAVPARAERARAAAWLARARTWQVAVLRRLVVAADGDRFTAPPADRVSRP